MNGTPKSLKEAIENAVREIGRGVGPSQSPAVGILESHVLDFLAQRFGAAMLTAPDTQSIEQLWEEIRSTTIHCQTCGRPVAAEHLEEHNACLARFYGQAA